MRQRRHRSAPVSTLRTRLSLKMRDKENSGPFGEHGESGSGEPFFIIAVFRRMHSFLLLKAGLAVALVFIVAVLYRGDYSWSRPALESLKQLISWDMELDAYVDEAVPAFRTFLGGRENSFSLRERDYSREYPLAWEKVSGYGIRDNPFVAREEMHYGVDLAAPAGTPVRAVVGGRVSGIYGENGAAAVIVDHEEGWQIFYGNLDRLQVQAGDAVEAGAILGLLGEESLWEQPHFHFELRYLNAPVEIPGEWFVLDSLDGRL